MTKLTGETFNIEEENIKKIKELFPEVDTDGKIDFDKLKQLLGNYVEDSDERYNFTWNGKGEALRISQTPSMGTLRPAPEESKNWDETENLYIEGDNLEVLKLLQKSYFNKIKMIYIDPPYNTGGDFVYKDNFKDNIKNYKEITGQIDSEGQHTTTNREYSGRYHTDWLNMMYPRLKLARNLLSENGIIYISIDDNEVDNLKKICDEIFGENNFVAKLPTIMNLNGNHDAYGFVDTHEYILCYVKSKTRTKFGYLPVSEEELKEWDIDDYGYWKRADTLRRTGQDASRTKRPKGWFPVFVTPKNEIYVTEDNRPLNSEDTTLYPVNDVGQELSWTWGKKKIMNESHNLMIVEGRNGINIYKKQRPFHGDIPMKKPKSILYKSSYSASTSTRRTEKLLTGKIFDAPKPVPLLKDLIRISNTEKSIILDFFAGSSTTAHAVMDLNAEDNGNRKYIMVQLPEETDKKSEAYKAGYENIAEIGKERIRRAGDQIKEKLTEKYEAANEEERKEMKHPDQLDIGFKTFKLDSSNIKEWNPGEYEDIQQAIEDTMTPYVKGRTEKDVVYEMILKMGLDLIYPVEEYEVNGQIIYSVGYGFLMISLADEIDLAIAEKMIEIKEDYQPEEFRVIFRDEGFRNDTDKTNIKETLRSAGLAEEAFITL